MPILKYDAKIRNQPVDSATKDRPKGTARVMVIALPSQWEMTAPLATGRRHCLLLLYSPELTGLHHSL